MNPTSSNCYCMSRHTIMYLMYTFLEIIRHPETPFSRFLIWREKLILRPRGFLKLQYYSYRSNQLVYLKKL